MATRPDPAPAPLMVAFPYQLAYPAALAAYRPGAPAPYFDWTARAWVEAMGPACLLAAPVDRAAPGGDSVCVAIPPEVNMVGVILHLIALDSHGVPMGTMAVEALWP